MKFFALCLVVLVVGAFADELTEKQKERLRSVVAQCINATKATPNIVKEMNKGQWTNVDRSAKCFSACSLNAIEFIKDGAQNEPVLREKLFPIFGDKKVEGAINSCAYINDVDDCEYGFKIFQCYVNNDIAVPVIY